MKFGLHLLFQVLGAMIIIGVLVTWMVTGRQSTILALGGFLLILAGALGGVETESEMRR